MTLGTLLLIEKCSHCLSYYDLDSGERTASVALPPFPHEFVVDPQRRYAYVGHYGVETSGHLGDGGHSILQIDLAGRRLRRTIDVPPYDRLHGMQMDERGRLYALSETAGVLLVFDDPAVDSAPSRAVPVGGIKSHLFALTPDGETAYAMNLLSHTVTRVKPHEPLVLPVGCHPGQKPEGYCLSADGSLLYVTNRISKTLAIIDTASMAVIHTTPSREDPTRIYRARDGRLLVTNYGERSISIVDPLTLEETLHVPMEARAIALSFHPTRPFAFVSQDDNRLGYFNLDTGMFERMIMTQNEPDVSFVLLDGDA